MIGIIGYGFVGKAVANGFSRTEHIVSDPKYNSVTTHDVCRANPEAIFVCLPTPSDDSNYSILKDCLQEIKDLQYKGIVAVKSTILPHHLEEFDVVLNPEFLSRATADEDFINPPFVLFGGKLQDCEQLNTIYNNYSTVDLKNVKYTDVKTASLAKYTFNSFYATKLTFMNAIYDITQEINVDFEELKGVLKMWPWMIGVSHLDVPGHEGRGFAGPCLPKDTQALADQFDVGILQSVLELNTIYRKEDKNGSN
jgi:UDPglucose 6-dehydrogenase